MSLHDSVSTRATPQIFPTRYLVVALVVFLFANRAKTQEPAPPGTVFQTSSNLVVLDVVVTDPAGKSITGLTQDDFTILEDGVAQSITSFEIPPGRNLPRSAIATGNKPDTKTGGPANAASPQALTILVIDELNTEVLDQMYARAGVEKFLAKHGPHLEQPTSLLLLGQKRLELLQDYTQDAHALTSALYHRHPELPFGLMASEFGGSSERLAKSLWALSQIAAANSHYEGRKNVIWVGPGFPALNSRMLDPADRPRFVNAVTESANQLLKARVSVYTVNPKGLETSPTSYQSGDGDSLLSESGDQATGDLIFESIAPDTGGEVFRLRNDVDVAIAESANDGSAYYSLAYYPTNHNWNGKYRRIKIVLRGQSLQARTRKGYFGVADLPLTDEQIDTVLSRAVMNPLPYRALEIEAKAKSAGAGKGRFLIKVDRHNLHWETLLNGNRRCEVTVVVAGVGGDDKVYSHKVTELESVVDSKRFEQQWNKPVAFDLVADLAPKTKHVRIVVRDAHSDHIGSADLSRDALPFR